MESKAKFLGHPLHPILIVFPLGLLATSFIFDIVRLITGDGTFGEVSFWMIIAGVIGGVLAAIFGLVDFLAIPSGTRAKSIGLLHGGGNTVVTLLFFISWLLRLDNHRDPGAFPFILSLIGVVIALFTGWLGGELVDRLRVGVDDGAHLDSPSSLSGRPADEDATSGPGRIGNMQPQ